MAKLVLARVQAMVLCDTVEESALETGTFDLEGVRSTFEVPIFPFTRPLLCVCLQMSGHVGKASCRLEINRSETDDVVYRTAPRVISLEGPTVVIPVVFRLRNCAFPRWGYTMCRCFTRAS